MRIRVTCIAILISAALLLPLSTGGSAESMQDETIAADKYVVAVGETVTFHIEPKPKITTPYPHVFNFHDGSAEETHKDTDDVRHRFKSAGKFSVSVRVESPPGIAPNEAGDPNPITIEVIQVQAFADPLQVEVGMPVTATATSVSKDPNLRYQFWFQDNQQPAPQWQGSNKAVDAYAKPGTYQVRVAVGFIERGRVVPVDSNKSQPINVTAPPPGTLVFHVPARVNAGDQVTLSAEFPANGRHIQYRFVFDDGTRSRWQDEAKVTHVYSQVRTYHPNVEVGLLQDQQPSPSTILTSPQETIEVVAVQVNVPSPTQTGDNQPPSTNTDWNRYLIPILIGLVALLVLVILTAGLIGIYKAVKWAFAPNPKFVPHIDVGRADMAQSGMMPVIQFELHLDPNVADGFYDIVTSEPSLIGAERSHS